MERVDSCGFECRCDTGGIEAFAPTRDSFITRNPQSEREVFSDFRFDRADHFEDGAGASRGLARRVLVLACVAPGSEERAEQHVAMGRVEFDSVIARVANAKRRCAVEIDDLLEFFLRDLS